MEDPPNTIRHCKQGKSDTLWRTSADVVKIAVTPTGTRCQSGSQLAPAGSFVAPHLRKEVVVWRKKT